MKQLSIIPLWLLRKICVLCCMALVGGGLARTASLDHLTIYVPGNPEGGFDKTSQSMRDALIALKMVEDVTIVHLPGAGGLIALANFSESQRGNATSVLIGGRTNIGATIFNNATISLRDLVPVARLTNTAIAIAVNAQSPIQDFGDLVEAMGQKSSLLRWIGGSSASVDEMLIMEIADQLGFARHMIHYFPTPGGGTAAVESFLGDNQAISVSSYEEIRSYAAQGKVRIIAVSGVVRIAGVDAPTLYQLGLAPSSQDWRGVFAPPGISEKEQFELADMFARMVDSALWRSDAQKYGWQDAWLTGEALERFVQGEFASVQSYSTKKDHVVVGPSQTLINIMSRRYQWTIIAVICALALVCIVVWQRHWNAVREHNLEDSLDKARQRAARAQAELEKALGGATQHINQQFQNWKLTPAENEIGWMLLKGLSFKEIAHARKKSERTVRQQARSIYAKSGLGSRSDLAAYFLEDFFSDET